MDLKAVLYGVGAALLAALAWLTRGQLAKREAGKKDARLSGLAATVAPEKAKEKAERRHSEIVEEITSADGDDATRVFQLFGGPANHGTKGASGTESDS